MIGFRKRKVEKEKKNKVIKKIKNNSLKNSFYFKNIYVNQKRAMV